MSDKYRELTPEEADRAYDEAPEEPLSPERIAEIVAYATAEPTPLPWHVGPPLRLMNRPHDLLISGNRHFSHEEGEEDDGSDGCQCDCDGDRDACDCGEGCGWSETTVAHVLGNETAGGITRANAERIVRAVNAHDGLIEGIGHAIDLMLFIKKRHPEVPDEGWAELDEVINHLRGVVMEGEVATGT